MPTKLELMEEAERRGILPPDKHELLTEARRRGLIAEPESSIVDKVTQFAFGVNTRLADVAEAPQAIADVILGPAFGALGGQRFQQGDNPLTAFLRQGETQLPRTTGERISRRVGEEVGATVPFAGLPFAIPKAAATTAIGRGVQAMAEGVRNAPAGAAIGELAATAGAGAGAGGAAEILPGSAGAEITGQLIGGLAPTALTMTPVGLAVRAARAAHVRVSPTAQTQRAREAVAKVLGPGFGEKTTQGIGDAETLSREIAGFEPTLAEASGSPSLIATQRRFEKEASGTELEEFAARREGSERAIERYARASAPKNAPLDETTTVARRNVRGILDRIRRDRTGSERRAEALAGTLEVVDRSRTGQDLRDQVIALKRQSSKDMSRLADELGLNDNDISIPFGDLREEILGSTQLRSVFEDTANRPDVLRTIEGVPPTAGTNQPIVTFADYQALRSRIGDDLRDAISAGNPSAKKIRELTRLRGVVDDGFNAIIKAADPELAGKYRAFRNTYREQHIERFEQGAAFKVRQKDGRGFYKVPDERVAEAFWKPGGVSEARQFKRVFGSSQDSAMEAVVLDGLRDSTVRNGRIDPAAFERWRRSHASVLEVFPGVQSRVDDIGRAATAMAERQAQLTTRIRKVEDLNLVRNLEQIAQGRPPEEVIRLALKSPIRMRTLLRRIRGNKDATNALKRHLWDKGLDGDTGAFIESNRRVLEMVLGKSHLDSLQRITQAKALLARVPPPAGRGFRPDPTEELGKQLGQGIPQIGSRVFAVKSGRIGWQYMALDMAGRLVRGRSILESDQLLKEALFNPAVARDMAALATFKRFRPAIARRLNVRLINLGLTSREEETETN